MISDFETEHKQYRLFGTKTNIIYQIKKIIRKINHKIDSIYIQFELAIEVSNRIASEKFNSVQQNKRICARSVMKAKSLKTINTSKFLALKVLLWDNECYRLNCVTPTPNVMVFGGGLWEIISFKWGDEGGALTLALVPLSEEEEILALSFCLSGHNKKANEKRALTRTKSANIFILDFSALRTVGNKGLLFKLPSLWYFVMVT